MTFGNGQTNEEFFVPVLEKLGLSSKEIGVYSMLLKRPSLTPGEIAKKLGIPRTTAQNILLRMEREGFAIPAREKGKLTYYAEHPDSILLRYRRTKNEIVSKYSKIEEELETAVPQLIGLMHSAKSIPQVRFFKGMEGAKEVLWDTLSSKTELKDFANIDAMFEIIKDINNEYVAAREKTQVTKRSLLLDTPFARSVYEGKCYSPKSHRGYKWISQDRYPFVTEMNIYDGKISYLTYVREEIVGVIIENDFIYQMHDSIWNLLWDSLE